MLEFLVTSKTKLALLKLLWGDKVEANANSLARLSQLAYPGVYAELQEMEKIGLVVFKMNGSSKVYFANKDFRFASLLKKLLSNEAISQEDGGDPREPSEEDVLLNMCLYGAPLGRTGTPRVALSIEETVAYALKLAHTNPTVARCIPILLYLNRNQLAPEKLRYFAEQNNEKQALGFFLELTAEISKHKTYQTLANKLFDKRIKKDVYFFHHSKGKFAGELAMKNTPDIAKKWKYVMNMELETFKTLFDKFVRTSA